MEIIVTDLTKFANEDIVCTAGIEKDSNECIRPIPYLKRNYCEAKKILPGSVIHFDGNFDNSRYPKPHVENCQYIGDVKNLGPCSSEKFRQILTDTDSQSVEEGFSEKITEGEKHFPVDSPPPSCSIITLSINPSKIIIFKDNYSQKKIQARFFDLKGKKFSKISVTDLGLRIYFEKYGDDGIRTINGFLKGQEQIFIRLGLTQKWKSPDGREGYWMQLNGIYTFPQFLKEARSY